MNYTRLFDLLPYSLDKHPKEDALVFKENGEWIKCSTNRYKKNAEYIAYGLIKLGVKFGDKIGIISNNRPEWNFADMGGMMIGAINVPIYPTISDHDLTYIIAETQMEYFFVSSLELYEKILRCDAKSKHIKSIISFNPINGALYWKDLLEEGRNNQDATLLTKIKTSILPSHCVTILYTSGTTGHPKGVMLSHDNIVSQLLAVKKLMPVNSKHRALSFLPLNHVYERMLLYNYFAIGTSIYYAESLETIGQDLLAVKPHIFTTVPRLLEKIYDKIIAKGNELTGLKRWLFFWSLKLAGQFEMNDKKGFIYKTQLKIARKLVFSKWKEALGGNLITAVSGGAALQEKLARIFWGAGIPVLQGYGLTETSPVIAVNYLKKKCNKFGTVGPVINHVQVKIAEDGEILVKGPNIMLGYFNNAEATNEVIQDGWFHTGDIGEFEDGRFLKITGRKKEIFKTSGGKYISPNSIEGLLAEAPFIEQVMVIGENQKFPAALIVPNIEYLMARCKENNYPYTTNEALIQQDWVIKLIDNHVSEVNATLAKYEAIKKFELLPHEWTIVNGELTPKLSLKRKQIMANAEPLIRKIYQSDSQ